MWVEGGDVIEGSELRGECLVVDVDLLCARHRCVNFTSYQVSKEVSD